ncbi:MAG: group I truncated hemoglobin [Candidatus Xenobia bacterium]
MKRLATFVLAVSLMVGVAVQTANAKSLYERLGGHDGIVAVVNDFVARAAADNRISKFFAHANVAKLKADLVTQIGQATGGPEQYSGPDMKTAHKNMKISDADFDALVDDLAQSMDSLHVRLHARHELLHKLAGMRDDIVTVHNETTASTAAPAADSLYNRLGGEKAITAVVDDFVGRVAQDARINHYFSSTDIPHLKHGLVTFISQATGGPSEYTGKSMHTVHQGMHITYQDWDDLVEDLMDSLNHFKVPQKEQTDLLNVIGTTKHAIVEEQ